AAACGALDRLAVAEPLVALLRRRVAPAAGLDAERLAQPDGPADSGSSLELEGAEQREDDVAAREGHALEALVRRGDRAVRGPEHDAAVGPAEREPVLLLGVDDARLEAAVRGDE